MDTILSSIIPSTITAGWIINLILACIVGLIAGKLLKSALWLSILIIIAYFLLQLVVITPYTTLKDFIDPEKLAEMGHGAMEWIKSIIPNIKEHIIANSTMFFAFIFGFIISFFIKKSS